MKSVMCLLNTHRIFLIGNIRVAKFGLAYGWPRKLQQLTACPNKLISKIFCGHLYNIFTDDNLDIILATGSTVNPFDRYGLRKDIKSSTEIKYFKENGININKIFVNLYRDTIFFISDENQLYRRGYLNGYDYQSKPKHIPHFNNVIDAK